MADNLTKEQRTKNMKAIRSSNTKLENRVTKALWKRGLRFRKNVKNLPGKPDIAIAKYKVVIFIDSCFWHGCSQHGNQPKSNKEYWIAKLERNRKRDEEITRYYQDKGWYILRIWEHEVKQDFELAVNTILRLVDESKNSLKNKKEVKSPY